MRIVSLIENLVYKQGLKGEHGFSLYIETESKKILFDTGQSDIFMQNAKALGINLNDVDAVVISHGHYDHTGGLYSFLRTNTKAKVFIKKEAFTPKYHGDERFIGLVKDDLLLEGRITYIDSVTEIDPGIFVMPEIIIYNSTDTHFRGMNIKQNGLFIPDEFNDELFIVIKSNEEINIITACSHRGITNICITATKYFNLPVNLILGGFHTKECSKEQIDIISGYMNQIQPKSIGVCHCTGVEKYVTLKNQLKSPAFYNFTGNSIVII